MICSLSAPRPAAVDGASALCRAAARRSAHPKGQRTASAATGIGTRARSSLAATGAMDMSSTTRCSRVIGDTGMPPRSFEHPFTNPSELRRAAFQTWQRHRRCCHGRAGRPQTGARRSCLDGSRGARVTLVAQLGDLCDPNPTFARHCVQQIDRVAVLKYGWVAELVHLTVGGTAD